MKVISSSDCNEVCFGMGGGGNHAAPVPATSCEKSVAGGMLGGAIGGASGGIIGVALGAFGGAIGGLIANCSW